MARFRSLPAPHTVALALLALAAGACGRQAPETASPTAPRELVSSIRAEPRGFNRYTGRDSVTETITHLTQARLVRIDRRTQELEPWLAESWSTSPDGLEWTLKLRQGVTFSDGEPFTAADVLFSFRAIYDPGVASPMGEAMRVGGKPLAVSAPDPSTVVIRFPAPFGPGIRLLDNLPILPRHKLEAALDAGTFVKAWDGAAPVGDIVGLGPFVIEQYQPGQRLVFARNPRYWRRDESGQRLPALDRLTLEIVPDQNAELLRLQAGQIDFTQTEVRPEDYATLRAAADEGRVTLVDLGVGLDADSFWINLRPGTNQARPWLHQVELRRAIAHAVDRQAFADTVFLGAATPVDGALITPGNPRWYATDLPRHPYDPGAAGALLASIGLVDRDGDGVREDRHGADASFTVLTMKGNSLLERGAAFVRDALGAIGLRVEVAPLEVGALIDRIERGDYEAIYFRFLTTDLDPALNMDLWLSSGGAHVWNPLQRTPATDWEREIDRLMHRQAATPDHAARKALFDQVQRIFAEHVPVLQFAAPRIFVALSTRVANATPALLRPAVVLWNPDRLDVREGKRASR
ncbi:MAG TPA: ABC transporter substrate-binding protein [Thermoanaerobaculales bacterium]|nr:ABC transporter substrate-binding protein [Thermoanaerobaculales bacterium]